MEIKKGVKMKITSNRKKGQIYMMIAGMIILAISTIASIALHTSMPIEKKQTQLSTSEVIAHNINNEIIQILKENESDSATVNDFIKIAEEYGKEKNINITVTVTWKK